MKSFLWITDPWESLDHPLDTTLRLVQEALKLGIKNYWCDVRSITWNQDRVLLHAKEIISMPENRTKRHICLGPSLEKEPKFFHQIHYRTDPPVDLAYTQPLQLLTLGLEKALGHRGLSRVINPPSILLSNNEKMEAAFIPNFMPPTIASSQLKPLQKFGIRYGKTVLKPMHEAQSHGVELLNWRSPADRKQALQLLQETSKNFSTPVILQRYLKGIHKGETRLWFLDGKLLAHAHKIPLHGDFRVNIDRGSRMAYAPLNPAEKKAATFIGKHLRKRAIRLAAVDLIDGFVTDFNFTSPGLIVQMEFLLKRNLAQVIIQALIES